MSSTTAIGQPSVRRPETRRSTTPRMSIAISGDQSIPGRARRAADQGQDRLGDLVHESHKPAHAHRVRPAQDDPRDQQQPEHEREHLDEVDEDGGHLAEDTSVSVRGRRGRSRCGPGSRPPPPRRIARAIDSSGSPMPVACSSRPRSSRSVGRRHAPPRPMRPWVRSSSGRRAARTATTISGPVPRTATRRPSSVPADVDLEGRAGRRPPPPRWMRSVGGRDRPQVDRHERADCPPRLVRLAADEVPLGLGHRRPWAPASAALAQSRDSRRYGCPTSIGCVLVTPTIRRRSGSCAFAAATARRRSSSTAWRSRSSSGSITAVSCSAADRLVTDHGRSERRQRRRRPPSRAPPVASVIRRLGGSQAWADGRD